MDQRNQAWYRRNINQVVDVVGPATGDAPAMRRAMLTTIGVPLLVAAASAEAVRGDLSPGRLPDGGRPHRELAVAGERG
jgi:hypothetical protein